MPKMERVREALHGKLDLDDMQRKHAAGWRLVALEWERESERPDAEDFAPARRLEEPPYGLRIAADCAHLEEDPEEMRALNTMMELIVQDISLPRMAEELNLRGLSARNGQPWSAVSVFNVFPRLIEATPRLFGESSWPARRREIARVTWNS